MGGNFVRAFGPGSSEPGVASDAEWPAGAWGDPVSQPAAGRLGADSAKWVTRISLVGTAHELVPHVYFVLYMPLTPLSDLDINDS